MIQKHGRGSGQVDRPKVGTSKKVLMGVTTGPNMEAIRGIRRLAYGETAYHRFRVESAKQFVEDAYTLR